MAIGIGQKRDEGFIGKLIPDHIEEAVRNVPADLLETGSGLLLGIPMIAGSAVSDIAHAPWEAPQGKFMPRFGRMANTMVDAFMEESPLPTMVDLLPGVDKYPRGEFTQRWVDRPVSGSLDFAGLIGGVTGGGSRLARAAAIATDNPKYLRGTDYRHVGPYTGVESVRNIGDVGDFRYNKGLPIGGEVYARPTHRLLNVRRDQVKDLLRDREITIEGGQAEYASRPKAYDYVLDEYKGREQMLKVPQRRSRNPAMAGIGDWWNGRADVTKRTKKARRILDKEITKSQYMSAAAANEMNRRPINEWRQWVEDTYGDRIPDGTRKKLGDYVAMMGLKGYSNIGMRLEDFGNAVPAAQALIARNKTQLVENARWDASVAPRARELKAMYDDMKTDMPKELNREMKVLFKEREKKMRQSARLQEEITNANNFVKNPSKKWDLKTGGKYWSGLINGKHADEAGVIRDNADLIDEMLQSDAMESLIANMQPGARQREKMAMFNYGDQLPEADMVRNRYRDAEVYTLEGAGSEASQARYRRPKKDGTGFWEPIHIPMRRERDVKRAAMKVGPKNPLAMHRSDNIGDPLDVERAGQLEMNPEILIRKHYEELHEFNRSKIIDGMGNESVAVNNEALPGMVAEGLVVVPKPDGTLGSMAPLVAYDSGSFLNRTQTPLAAALASFADELSLAGHKIEARAIQDQFKHLLTKQERLASTRRYGQSQQSKKELWDVDFKNRTMLIPRETYLSLMDHHIDMASNIIQFTRKGEEPLTRTAELAEKAQKFNNLWKNTVLQWRPKWMYNNAIGMAYMLSLHEGWWPAFTNILENSGLRKWADETMDIAKRERIIDDSGRTIFYEDLYREQFYDVLGSTGTTAVGAPMGPLERTGGKVVQGHRRFIDWVNAVNAKYFDNPARQARLHQIMKEEIRDYRMQMDDAGRTAEHANMSDLAVAHKLLDDIDFRDRVAEKALGDMIDFQDLSRNERMFVAVGFSPFWSWIKGSTKAQMRAMGQNPRRYPIRAYAGDAQQQILEEEMGTDLPSFLKASIPGNFLGIPGMGQRDVLSFAAASPAETLASVGTIGMWPVLKKPQYGSENPLGMSGPLISIPAGLAMGKHPFYGTPLPEQPMWQSAIDLGQPPMMKWLRSGEMWGPIPKNPFATPPLQPGSSRTVMPNQWASLAGMGPLPRYMEVRPRQAGQRAREEMLELQ